MYGKENEWLFVIYQRYEEAYGQSTEGYDEVGLVAIVAVHLGHSSFHFLRGGGGEGSGGVTSWKSSALHH